MSTEKSDPAPEHHAKMAVQHESPPGIELDSKGNVIPLEQRTRDDKLRAATRDPSAEAPAPKSRDE